MVQTLDKIQTKNQNEVRLYSVEPLYYEKTLLIIGVMHGDEWQGEPLIEKMMKYSPKKNRLLFIPCLNPDGKELKTRQNANQVDLNRNFPTKKLDSFRKKRLLRRSIPCKRRGNKICHKNHRNIPSISNSHYS